MSATPLQDEAAVFDYIVVGAGTAGCILAARLSEDPGTHVLLIEAGGRDNSPWIALPAGYVKSYQHPRRNWRYATEPQDRLHARRLYAPRGKVQGGSGSINAMIFVRGQAGDFDDWADAGNPGWRFDDVLPAFRALEDHPGGAGAWRGRGGPIGLTPMRDAAHPICQDFLRACTEAGLPLTDDFNGAQFEGGGIYEANIRAGQRDSTSRAYLHPAQGRPNLVIERHAYARCIVLDAEGRARAVQVRQGEALREFRARREIVVAAGAVDTPKLLQLSGIGDGAQLQALGIAVRRDLPAVGTGLQDHLATWWCLRANRPTLNDALGTAWGQMRAGLSYALARRGPLALSVNQAGGFFRVPLQAQEAPPQRPNVQLYFNPLSYQVPDTADASLAPLAPDPFSGFLMGMHACRPTSRGEVRIASPDPDEAPRIDPRYLSTPHDEAEAIAGARLVERLLAAPALAALTVQRESAPPADAGDAALLDHVRGHATSIYHLCGSCAMGPDARHAVVDAKLRVHGVPGLRVIDASVFPNITSGNTQAAVMMLAERGAALLRTKHRA